MLNLAAKSQGNADGFLAPAKTGIHRNDELAIVQRLRGFFAFDAGLLRVVNVRPVMHSSPIFQPITIGVVVIGRNEGERLIRCLQSASTLSSSKVVYVDSGSTDGSRAIARSLRAEVVELDMTTPFTAARARNRGFACLRELDPELAYVQFVDGDCEVVNGWLEKAVAFMAQHEYIAVICGRRRERFPGHSIYNLLCNQEWNTPIGEAKACGGDALMRVDAFMSVNGFREDLIAGEEPELCLRLRAKGWRIWRLDAEMTLHDAAITRFGQWWKRTMRTGYGYAQVAYLHKNSPEPLWIRESFSAWLWGGVIPAVIVACSIVWGLWGGVLLLIYPIQVIRLSFQEGTFQRNNGWRALFLVLGKFPEFLGHARFFCNLISYKKPTIIEYK